MREKYKDDGMVRSVYLGIAGLSVTTWDYPAKIVLQFSRFLEIVNDVMSFGLDGIIAAQFIVIGIKQT